MRYFKSSDSPRPNQILKCLTSDFCTTSVSVRHTGIYIYLKCIYIRSIDSPTSKVNLQETTHAHQKTEKQKKELLKMASELDQFADLELSKEDREQIFDPPLDRQQLEGAGTSRYVPQCNYTIIPV